MAKTHTHSTEWKDKGSGFDLLIKLAAETGERALITDVAGNPIAAIVPIKDLDRLEEIETTE